MNKSSITPAEPTLRRTFGTEFDAYSRRVPRWLPRAPWSRPSIEDRRL